MTLRRKQHLALAGLLGLGLTVTSMADANAATPQKTYPVQVTLAGNPCLLKGAKLTKWNLTYQVTSDYGLPGRGDTLNGGATSKTHIFDVARTGQDGWFLVQTWCGKGAFSRLLGRASDACGSVPVNTDKRHPAKVSIDIQSAPTGSDECVGY
jgi:hypothetical protein